MGSNANRDDIRWGDWDANKKLPRQPLWFKCLPLHGRVKSQITLRAGAYSRVGANYSFKHFGNLGCSLMQMSRVL